MRDFVKSAIWTICAVPSVIYGVTLAVTDIVKSRVHKFWSRC